MTQQLTDNIRYKLNQQPFVRNITGGMSISYVIKIMVVKRTENEVFHQLFRYDYNVIDDKICDAEYFTIEDITWIGEMNDTNWGETNWAHIDDMDNCLMGGNCDY
jgi:hypothetical protein